MTHWHSAQSSIAKLVMWLFLLRLRYKIAAWFAPRITARALLRLFMTPYPKPKPSKWSENFDRLETIEVDFGQEKLLVWRFGNSTRKVLLCHGWRGKGTNFKSWIPPLVESGFEVVTFDGPAHGLSQRKQTDSVEFCEFVKVISEKLGPFEAIVGHSFGTSAVMLALLDGMKTSRTVLVSPYCSGDGNLKRFCEVLHVSKRIQSLMYQELQKKFATHWEGWDHRNVLAKVDMPILIIHDNEDKVVPIEESERLVSGWPKIDRRVTQGLGHYKIMKDSSVISDVLTFLRA